jgi:hypothetical protein
MPYQVSFKPPGDRTAGKSRVNPPILDIPHPSRDRQSPDWPSLQTLRLREKWGQARVSASPLRGGHPSQSPFFVAISHNVPLQDGQSDNALNSDCPTLPDKPICEGQSKSPMNIIRPRIRIAPEGLRSVAQGGAKRNPGRTISDEIRIPGRDDRCL